MELLERCKKGDKEALGLLYTTYSKRMMCVICHYIPDLNAARDILHDGFLIISVVSTNSGMQKSWSIGWGR